MTDSMLKERLQAFIESEGKSCSMDFGCITPEYVYRMWGGKFSIEEIENGLAELKSNMQRVWKSESTESCKCNN